MSIWTHHDRAWVRNLRDDPRTAFTAQQVTPPYGAVILRGQAEARTGGDDIDTEIRRIVSRYLPPDDCEGYIAAWPHLQTIVRIRPENIRGWAADTDASPDLVNASKRA